MTQNYDLCKVFGLYADMLKQTHVLIAGASGSGKSVVINGMIATALRKSPSKVQFILIDPKRVELVTYRDLPHTIKYASEPADMLAALQLAMNHIEARFDLMQAIGVKKFPGSHIYVIIDELADLMTTMAKEVTPLIQRICQIGRAAGVSIVAATQCPLSTVIPTAIKVNFDARVALRTASAQHSRNIMDATGCEKLPRYGKAYYITPAGKWLAHVPMISDEEIAELKWIWTEDMKPIKEQWTA